MKKEKNRDCKRKKEEKLKGGTKWKWFGGKEEKSKETRKEEGKERS